MSDIFISYAKEDRGRARVLAAALEGSGWSVFWDRTIPPGLTWHDYIGREIQEARCVLVAWSESAIQSSWVLEEAGEARKRGVLVPLFLEDVEPPLGFRSLQAADLSKWSGDTEAPAFRQLVEGVERLLGFADDGGTEAAEREAVLPSAGSRWKADELPRERSPSRAAFFRTRSGLVVVGAVLVALVLVIQNWWPETGSDSDHDEGPAVESVTGEKEPPLELTSTFDKGDDDEGWWTWGAGSRPVTPSSEEDCRSKMGGCLHLEDESTDFFYFRAPPHWVGDADWTRFHAGSLNYWLRRKWKSERNGKWVAHVTPLASETEKEVPADLIIVGSGERGSLELRIPMRPREDWGEYAVPLTEGKIGIQSPEGVVESRWVWIKGAERRDATGDDFGRVLESVDDLRIRGEYWSGPDEAWLDSVSIEPAVSPGP
ncbi:MAG: TIR domain-containing protein [bacterium]|nr:TIR domain-containing protein [bacterium]